VREFLNDFRKFVMRGNLVEIAVAFILGLYFKDVVDSFTNGIVLAFVAAIFGKPNFKAIGFHVNKSFIAVGAFLNAMINFVIVAFVLFLIIKVYETLKEHYVREADTEPLTQEAEILSEIRDLIATQQR
jgi:large conductance mechanosensitive channel